MAFHIPNVACIKALAGWHKEKKHGKTIKDGWKGKITSSITIQRKAIQYLPLRNCETFQK